MKNFLKINNKFIFLFVGAIEEDKRLDILLKAFTQVYKDNDNSHLVIVGDGPNKSNLEELSTNLEIQNNVTFTGSIIDGVNIYFQVADVFVLPGRGGLAIPQAMVNGLPVISGLADGTEWDFVINGKTGYRVREVDDKRLIQQIYDKMKYFVENRDIVEAMSVNAMKLIEERYNINTFLWSLYNSILLAYGNNMKGKNVKS